ncbi:hypothetical protein Bbelb_261500, partial [Branchiostoma belcheri]
MTVRQSVKKWGREGEDRNAGIRLGSSINPQANKVGGVWYGERHVSGAAVVPWEGVFLGIKYLRPCGRGQSRVRSRLVQFSDSSAHPASLGYPTLWKKHDVVLISELGATIHQNSYFLGFKDNLEITSRPKYHISKQERVFCDTYARKCTLSKKFIGRYSRKIQRKRRGKRYLDDTNMGEFLALQLVVVPAGRPRTASGTSPGGARCQYSLAQTQFGTYPGQDRWYTAVLDIRAAVSPSTVTLEVTRFDPQGFFLWFDRYHGNDKGFPGPKTYQIKTLECPQQMVFLYKDGACARPNKSTRHKAPWEDE